jgi:hypothetical protein
MTSADIGASSAQARSVQAFYLAESGLEVEQRRWAQNLNWYRSATVRISTRQACRRLGRDLHCLRQFAGDSPEVKLSAVATQLPCTPQIDFPSVVHCRLMRISLPEPSL